MRQLPQLATRPGGETNKTAPLISSNTNEAATKTDVIARHMNRDFCSLITQGNWELRGFRVKLREPGEIRLPAGLPRLPVANSLRLILSPPAAPARAG